VNSNLKGQDNHFSARARTEERFGKKNVKSSQRRKSVDVSEEDFKKKTRLRPGKKGKENFQRAK